VKSFQLQEPASLVPSFIAAKGTHKPILHKPMRPLTIMSVSLPLQERLLEWGVHRLPVVLSLHPPARGPDDVSSHTGPFDVVTLRHFVGLRRLPLIVSLGVATWPDVSNDSRPVVLVVLKEAGSVESEAFLRKVGESRLRSQLSA
jgi:hypothetical protein